jgi:hypothetical protein
MPDRDRAEPERRAKSAWRTGRPSRWRVRPDAQLRQQEGAGAPEDVEPGVVDGILREREGLLGILFDDGDDDQAR